MELNVTSYKAEARVNSHSKCVRIWSVVTESCVRMTRPTEMKKPPEERMASAPLWPSNRGRSIDSPSVRHTASLTEACWSTGPGISRGVQGAPLHHGVSRRWNELSTATRSMADIRVSGRWEGRMKGGRKEGERASWSYYLHLAVRNHGVMHYMCSLLCSVCKRSTNRGERDEKCSFRSIRFPYTTVCSRTGRSVPAYFCL